MSDDSAVVPNASIPGPLMPNSSGVPGLCFDPLLPTPVIGSLVYQSYTVPYSCADTVTPSIVPTDLASTISHGADSNSMLTFSHVPSKLESSYPLGDIILDNTCQAPGQVPSFVDNLEVDSSGLPMRHSLSPADLVIALDRLLSREAILTAKDEFISVLVQSSMHEHLAISADALTGHPQLCPVSGDALLQAADTSTILDCDRIHRLIFPEIKAKRATLILRDVDLSITKNDILLLLKECPDLDITLPSDNLSEVDSKLIHSTDNMIVSDCCNQILSLHLVGENTWFLTLKDEIITQNVAWWIRSQQLKGTQVQVRIKTESPLRLALAQTSLVHRENPQMLHNYPSTCTPPNPTGRRLRPVNEYGSTHRHARKHGYRTGTSNRRLSATTLCEFCQINKSQKESTTHKHINKSGKDTTESSDVVPQLNSTTGEARCLCHLLHVHQPTDNSTIATSGVRSMKRGGRRRRGKQEGVREDRTISWRANSTNNTTKEKSNKLYTSRRGKNNATNNIPKEKQHQLFVPSTHKAVIVTSAEFPPLGDSIGRKNVTGSVYKTYTKGTTDFVTEQPIDTATNTASSSNRQTDHSEVSSSSVSIEMEEKTLQKIIDTSSPITATINSTSQYAGFESNDTNDLNDIEEGEIIEDTIIQEKKECTDSSNSTQLSHTFWAKQSHRHRATLQQEAPKPIELLTVPVSTPLNRSWGRKQPANCDEEEKASVSKRIDLEALDVSNTESQSETT